MTDQTDTQTAETVSSSNDSDELEQRIDNLRDRVVTQREGSDPSDELLRPEWPPFDYERIGPRDLVSILLYWAKERLPYLFGAGVLLVGGYGYGQSAGWWGAIEIPVEVWVVLFAALGAVVIGWIPVRKGLDLIWSDENYHLVDVDPVNGDLTVYELSQYTFQQLDVRDSSGDIIDNPNSQLRLHEIQLGDRGRAYEVDHYDPDANEAQVSWMADVDNVQIRRHQRAVDIIRSELSKEAERSLDEIIEAPEAIRQHGSAVVNEMIRLAEGERSPGDGSVADEIGAIVEDQQDQTQDLIEDRGIDNLQQRIEEMEDSSDQEGAA
jgi:hypothetical protein